MIVIIFLLFCEIHYSNRIIYHHSKIIFSFWEPQYKIPGYLSLCIKTWKHFLPDYQIKILDYSTLKSYLGDELYSNIICKNMPLSMQADAIRVALLKKYGGLWLDTDSIIINGSFTKEFEKYELTMIGEERNKFQYMGFIFASQNSSILYSWLNRVVDKVKIYKINLNRNKNNLTEKMKKFDYLGNSIIDPLLKNYTRNSYFRVDSKKINAFPETTFFKNSSKTNIEKYRAFYFGKGEPNIFLNRTKYLLLLHNSWTPIKYKNMTEEEFLSQNILLSKILSQILKGKSI